MCECVWSRSVVSDSLRPRDCSLSGFSVHGILQARILEWVTISFSRGSSVNFNKWTCFCFVNKWFTIKINIWFSKHTHTHTQISIQMFITALFVIIKNKMPKCPSVSEWINHGTYSIQTMEYQLAMDKF